MVARIKNKMNVNQDISFTETFRDPLKIKVEPDEEISIEEHELLNSIQGYEAIEPSDRFLTNLLIKQEHQDYISNKGTNITSTYLKPYARCITEVTIKEEPVAPSYKCLERFNNSLKYLTVTIPKLKCYMCDHCPIFCKKKRDLVWHIHKEHYLMFRNVKCITKSLHNCILCNKKLTYKRWHEHMAEVHCAHPLKCNECEKTFKHQRYLKRHLMYVHGNIRPTWRFRKTSSENLKCEVKCPACSKQLNNKYSLKIHIKTCHSETPYTCKLCNSQLKCKIYLNAHMRRVHYDDGKKHRCDICGKKFKSPRYLSIHKKNSHHVSIKKKKKEI